MRNLPLELLQAYHASRKPIKQELLRRLHARGVERGLSTRELVALDYSLQDFHRWKGRLCYITLPLEDIPVERRAALRASFFTLLRHLGESARMLPPEGPTQSLLKISGFAEEQLRFEFIQDMWMKQLPTDPLLLNQSSNFKSVTRIQDAELLLTVETPSKLLFQQCFAVPSAAPTLGDELHQIRRLIKLMRKQFDALVPQSVTCSPTEIAQRFCRCEPNDKGYFRNESNGGSCIAQALCAH
jgi:hypothetical protein